MLPTQPIICPCSSQYLRCSPKSLRLGALITDASCPTLSQMLTSVPQTKSSHHRYQLPPLSRLSSDAYSACQLSLFPRVPQILTSVPQTWSSHHRYQPHPLSRLSIVVYSACQLSLFPTVHQMLTSVPQTSSSHHRYQLSHTSSDAHLSPSD